MVWVAIFTAGVLLHLSKLWFPMVSQDGEQDATFGLTKVEALACGNGESYSEKWQGSCEGLVM